MSYIYKLATLNIQGISSETRLQMLNQFLHVQGIHIALLQEITMHQLYGMSQYNVYMNRGTEGRGTAILTKEDLEVKNILRLPTGRGMAAEINGTWIINIHAPSGAGKRTEREHFFTHEVTALMPPVRREIILAGDFNAIIDKYDNTSQNNIRRALKTLISGCALSDVWETTQNRHGYTYYANKTASRIDRIYVTQRLYSQKTGVQRVAAAFKPYGVRPTTDNRCSPASKR